MLFVVVCASALEMSNGVITQARTSARIDLVANVKQCFFMGVGFLFIGVSEFLRISFDGGAKRWGVKETGLKFILTAI